MNEWLSNLSPGIVLKWGAVVFCYCIGILVIVSIVLAILEAA